MTYPWINDGAAKTSSITQVTPRPRSRERTRHTRPNSSQGTPSSRYAVPLLRFQSSVHTYPLHFFGTSIIPDRPAIPYKIQTMQKIKKLPFITARTSFSPLMLCSVPPRWSCWSFMNATSCTASNWNPFPPCGRTTSRFICPCLCAQACCGHSSSR